MYTVCGVRMDRPKVSALPAAVISHKPWLMSALPSSYAFCNWCLKIKDLVPNYWDPCHWSDDAGFYCMHNNTINRIQFHHEDFCHTTTTLIVYSDNSSLLNWSPWKFWPFSGPSTTRMSSCKLPQYPSKCPGWHLMKWSNSFAMSALRRPSQTKELLCKRKVLQFEQVSEKRVEIIISGTT